MQSESRDVDRCKGGQRSHSRRGARTNEIRGGRDGHAQRREGRLYSTSAAVDDFLAPSSISAANEAADNGDAVPSKRERERFLDDTAIDDGTLNKRDCNLRQLLLLK